MQSLKKISTLVEKTLETYPSARNSDAQLVKWFYFQHFGIGSAELFGEVLERMIRGELPFFDTITRCRRKIQEEGKKRARAEVEANRKELEKLVKNQILDWDNL